MTNLTRVINGKLLKGADNIATNTAGMIATGLALTTAIAAFTPAANAAEGHKTDYIYEVLTLPADAHDFEVAGLKVDNTDKVAGYIARADSTLLAYDPTTANTSTCLS